MRLDVPVALAIGAGMLATVNPCGFAMLPAYIGFFVGQEEDRDDRANPIGRALVVTATVTLGFLAVFATTGLAVTFVARSLDNHLSWLTIAVGLGFVGLGLYLLTGRQLAVALPKLERGGRTRSLTSMFVFGVSYAVASLSCTLPVFLTTLTPTFRNAGVAAGLATFACYALGMGLVLGALTLAVAMARTAFVTRLRRMLPYVSRVSGALLVAAGAYIAYYGWWEQRGEFAADPVVDTAFTVQGWLADQVDALPRGPLVVGLGVAVLVALTASRRYRRRESTSDRGTRQ